MSIKVAIIGAGAISREHIAALKRIPNVEVRLVVSRDPDRARDVAALTGAVWSTRLEDAFGRDIDAVDICQRNPLHAPLAIAAAQHGKNILVEKPVALSLEDFDRMAAAARENKVSLMVGQTLRFQPVHWQLKKALDEGKIGQLRVLHSNRYAGYLWPNGWRAWQMDEAVSGGHLRHNGAHPLDFAIWFFGKKPARVFTRTFKSWAAGMPTPDGFNISLRFEDGGLALLEFSYALREKGDSYIRLLAVGDKGSLLHTSEGEGGVKGNGVHLPSPATEDAMYYEMAHWVKLLQGEEEPVVRLEQVRHTLLATLAAHQSYKTGRAVTIGENGIE